jgi:uncharacterized protein GlcG (DUF336 family)
MKNISVALAAILFSTVFAQASFAKQCAGLPSQAELKKALVEARKETNGGFNLDMWGTLVDRSGVVCAVAYTGAAVDSQWPGSRVISAQKANTANAFSLAGLSLSTGNLWAATQPGGSLFGLQESNPVNINVAYKGDAAKFGSPKDPLIGERIGGVNVFGGGLALYTAKGEIIGGLGVSGDSSCADHNIAWRTRKNLNLDYIPGGVAPDKSDAIIYDVSATGKSAGGFGHVVCAGKEKEVAATLPAPAKVQK